MCGCCLFGSPFPPFPCFLPDLFWDGLFVQTQETDMYWFDFSPFCLWAASFVYRTNNQPHQAQNVTFRAASGDATWFRMRRDLRTGVSFSLSISKPCSSTRRYNSVFLTLYVMKRECTSRKSLLVGFGQFAGDGFEKAHEKSNYLCEGFLACLFEARSISSGNDTVNIKKLK